MPVNKMVTISEDEYEQLQKESAWLRALKAAGVDNWDGYDYAREIFLEENGDDDDDA